MLAQAAHWYVHVFGDRPAIWDDADVDEPTVRRRLRVGGWVDLTLRTDDGGHELRQFSLWGGRVPDEDPLELAALRVAFLRLTPWLDGAPLRLAWVDLVRGLVRERIVEPDERHEITEWFESRRRARARTDRRSGHRAGRTTAAGAASSPRAPSTARARTTAAGATCSRASCTSRRPASTPGAGARANGATATCSASRPATAIPVPCTGSRCTTCCGSCTSRGRVATPPTSTTCSSRTGSTTTIACVARLARHTATVPVTGRRHSAHEMTRARFSHHPTTPFMATARLDALWVHDGLLDARDYKTGQVWSDRVADDAQARLQAWVLAPLAEAHGLQLRVTFEHLAAEVVDDPEPFEPDADDLLAIEDELRAEVTEIRSEVEFAGVADPDVCHRCSYRSICPDSVVAGVPIWPSVEAEDEVDMSASRRPHVLVGRHPPLRAVRERTPLPALLHDGRRLPTVRAALRARAGLLGGRAGDQHRPRRRGVHRHVRRSRSCSPCPTSRSCRCSPSSCR